MPKHLYFCHGFLQLFSKLLNMPTDFGRLENIREIACFSPKGSQEDAVFINGTWSG